MTHGQSGVSRRNGIGVIDEHVQSRCAICIEIRRDGRVDPTGNLYSVGNQNRVAVIGGGAIGVDGEVIAACRNGQGLQGSGGEVVDDQVAIGVHIDDIGTGTLRDGMQHRDGRLIIGRGGGQGQGEAEGECRGGRDHAGAAEISGHGCAFR